MVPDIQLPQRRHDLGKDRDTIWRQSLHLSQHQFFYIGRAMSNPVEVTCDNIVILVPGCGSQTVCSYQAMPTSVRGRHDMSRCFSLGHFMPMNAKSDN